MSGVQTLTVAPEDAEIRLDRWFKRHFPALGHGRLEKLLRTGQVRLDGKRVEASDRVAAGQRIRVPPLPAAPPPEPKPAPATPSEADTRLLRERVLYRDDEIIVINKPEGLAVQGGTGTSRHLDGLLDALRFDAKERPRLVHRLDKDTSGVLVLARNARAAARLGELFRSKSDAQSLLGDHRRRAQAAHRARSISRSPSKRAPRASASPRTTRKAIAPSPITARSRAPAIVSPGSPSSRSPAARINCACTA